MENVSQASSDALYEGIAAGLPRPGQPGNQAPVRGGDAPIKNNLARPAVPLGMHITEQGVAFGQAPQPPTADFVLRRKNSTGPRRPCAPRLKEGR